MKKTDNKPKFTKEEWRITEWLEITTSRKGIVEGSKKICQVSDFSKTEEEARANAQLISASPEMYEALKKVQRMLEEWENRDQESFNKYCHIDAHIETDKALSKAEGK